MAASYQHDSFQTTGTEGLSHSILPMRLYHKAKKLGTWDPRDLDFTQDRVDWLNFTEPEKEMMLRLISMFAAGEESVTRDLLPLMMVMAREGRLEEEMFLTTFLWEESKHTEFFRRYVDEVVQDHSDLSRFHLENYRKVFYEELPEAMNRLTVDSSPHAQARASVTYNMIVEGVLAETGYQAFLTVIQERNISPGLQKGIGLLKRDESRHIAYGIYLLSRLIAEDHAIWDTVQKRMDELLPYAIGVVNEIFVNKEEVPFGLNIDDFVNYAVSQFSKRMDRVERVLKEGIDHDFGLDDEQEEVS